MASPARSSWLLTRPELARVLGVTAARVTKYVADGMPCQRQGPGQAALFDAPVCVQWLLERRQGRPGDDERARYFKLQADKVEQDIRIRAGELIEAEEELRQWRGVVAACRERLLALPAVALQRGLVDADGEAALIDLVDQALAELAARGGHDAAA